MNNETHPAMTTTSDNASAEGNELVQLATQAPSADGNELVQLAIQAPAAEESACGEKTVQAAATLDIPKGVSLSPVGIIRSGEKLEREEYNRLFRSVLALSKASNWLLGDTLDLADRTWGNQISGSKYAEASKATGLSISTLRQIVSVCHRIPLEQRHPNLSFTHHMEACFKTNSYDECKDALTRAEQSGMPVKAFRKDLLERRAATMTEDDGVRDLPGELCPEDEASKWRFPCALEFARIADWIEHTDMMKVDDFDRENLLRVVLPTLRQLYYLLQIEKDENPDAELDVPFEIKPLD